MDSSKLGVTILAIVGVIALSSMVLMYNNTAGLYVYEQPASNKPAFVQPSQYIANFDMCNQYLCTYPSEIYGYGENEPAIQIGTDTLTGNLRCGCPDGREFQIRPDLLLEGHYS